MKVILAGATGFIGRALISEMIQSRHEVVLLTRSPQNMPKPFWGAVQAVVWDGQNAGAWEECLEGSQTVINLCGEPIAGKKWTPGQKQKIFDSRIQSTAALVRAIHKAREKPETLVNASAVGYYGWDCSDEAVTETHAPGQGFLAQTCEAWEREALRASDAGVRVALARLGIVLEKDGGALQKMMPPFLCFAGGPLGSGKQWFPWVHREDAVGMLLFAMLERRVSGAFNVCSPEPVRMKRFAEVLARTLNRPSWLPVPGLLLRLMLGEMSEMLLKGQKAVPQRMTEWGYVFRYPGLEAALESLLRSSAG